MIYTNKFLLDIIEEHIGLYRDSLDDIVEVVVEGETIDNNRITTFRIVTPNNFELYENTQTKTGDPIEFAK